MIKTLKILRQLLQQSLGLELPVFKFVMQPQEIHPHRPWLDLDVNLSPNIPPTHRLEKTVLKARVTVAPVCRLHDSQQRIYYFPAV